MDPAKRKLLLEAIRSGNKESIKALGKSIANVKRPIEIDCRRLTKKTAIDVFNNRKNNPGQDELIYSELSDITIEELILVMRELTPAGLSQIDAGKQCFTLSHLNEYVEEIFKEGFV